MKKLLLLPIMVLGYSAQAQVYWEEESTGFATASTGVNEIRYVNEADVWVTGYDGSGGAAQFRVWAKSGDAGNTWTNGAINVGSTNLGIGSLSPISSSTAWTAAFPNTPTVQGGIWKTADGGATWTKQASASFNTGTDSFTNFVHMWDANVGVCGGDPAGGYFELYTTSNGGVTWTRVPSSNIPVPLTGEYGYTRIYETAGSRIWFGTNKGRIFRSDNNGLNWEAFQTPCQDFGDADLGAAFSFDDMDKGIMVFRDWSQYRSVDGGQNWTMDLPEGTIRSGDVTYVGGETGVLVNIGEDLIDGNRGASISGDDGLTWIDLGEAIDAVSAVEFFDFSHGLASGFTASAVEGGIYRWINDLRELLGTQNFQETKAFTASPNPTSGDLNINGKNISSVAIFDILGKQVANYNFGSVNAATVNMGSLNAGVYMVKVSNNEGTSTLKVVKQ
ncbi:T9SS type A sorting domain-containing protein [Flavobacterium sp.]|uniref:T9SS type A sorting domain-containing protein n=1 Tax=Flavobacterium sp. TaxID=239 RepID=UPI0039E54028